MAITTAQTIESSWLSIGRLARLSTTLIDPSDARKLKPDPWTAPTRVEQGFILGDTVTVPTRITLHQEPNRRTVWLVFDEVNAPLTGVYSGTIEGNGYSYNATTSAPANFDALLDDLVIEMNANISGDAVASKAKIKGSSFDAIKVVANQSAASSSTGVGAGATYTGFSCSSLSAPQSADLYLLREVDTCSARLWEKRGYKTTSAVDANLNGAVAAQQDTWVVSSGGDLGALTHEGFDDNLSLQSRSALFVNLYSPVTTDTIVIAGSGDGLYGVVNVATIAVSPSVID